MATPREAIIMTSEEDLRVLKPLNTRRSIIIPARPVNMKAPIKTYKNSDQTNVPSDGASLSGNSQSVHIMAIPTYMPSMKYSLCAKLPYR